MTQQFLQGHQIDAGFEQVGGVTVPQRVHRDPFAQPGGTHGATADLLGGGDAEVAVAACAGEEPGAWPVLTPVVTQQSEQPFREGDETVLAALGVAEVQQTPRAIDVGDLQSDNLGDTQAAGVGEAEEQTVAWAGQSVQEALHLGAAEDGGQGAGLLAVGDAGDEVGSAEGDGVEETQGSGGLVEEAPGDFLPQEVELEVTELRGGELLGRGGSA